MPVTIYQDSRPRARPRPGQLAACAAACAVGAGGLFACTCRNPSTEAGADSDAEVRPAPKTGKTIHFSRLRPFLPDKLLELEGEAATASTSQFGDEAVSEAERSYRGGGREVKIRLVDTSLNRGRPSTPGVNFDDEKSVGRPANIQGAVGFVEYEKESRRARADLVVAERLLVTVTCENARGPEEVERLASGLKLNELAALARDATP
jgi:hypothetical protein